MCSYQGRSLTAVATPLPRAHIPPVALVSVIWKCVEISKRIYKNKKIQWRTDQHRLMSRTPCNGVADHQGATDPRLKTPDLYHSYVWHVIRTSSDANKCHVSSTQPMIFLVRVQ